MSGYWIEFPDEESSMIFLELTRAFDKFKGYSCVVYIETNYPNRDLFLATLLGGEVVEYEL